METTSNSPFAVLKYALVTWWDSAIPLALYSIGWMFLCITVIFAAPATFALFYLISEILDETMPTPREVLRAMFSHFFRSWGWLLANVAAGAIIWINWGFYRGLATAWADGLSWFIAGVAIVWYGIQFFAVPFYLIQERRSLLLAWRNALFSSLASPGYTAVLWIAIGVLIAVSAILVVPIILGVPALLAMIGSVAVRERVATYKAVTKEKQAAQDEAGDEE